MKETYEKQQMVIEGLENLSEGRIICQQHAWNKIKEVMIDYPKTVGVPLLELAKERPIKIFIQQGYYGVSKPCLKENGNNVTIVVNG